MPAAHEYGGFWRVGAVCLHLKHHFTHAAATDASLVERDGRRRLSVGIVADSGSW